jgi:hypothetical protein
MAILAKIRRVYRQRRGYWKAGGNAVVLQPRDGAACNRRTIMLAVFNFLHSIA